MASASAKTRKKSAKAEAEEELLEKGRWSGFNEQHQLEAANHSQVENEMARTRMLQFLSGGTAAITPDTYGEFPE